MTECICAAVFTSKRILVYKEQAYISAMISNKISTQVLVGDVVVCEERYGEWYVVDIVARKNVLSRRRNGQTQGLAANVDIVFIVTSANQDFNLARLERYFFIAKESNARICFVLSKTDLNEWYPELVEILEKRFPQCMVAATNIYDQGETLLQYWNAGETAVFLGSSGVGKSSLVNRLTQKESAKTNAIRNADDKGRHTTTSRHMYVLEEQRKVIDTPGLRSVGISANGDTLAELFPDISELVHKCRFSDCTHTNEPNCAVREAIEREEIEIDDVSRYLKLSGDEKKRELFLHGKRYQKENELKNLKKRSSR